MNCTPEKGLAWLMGSIACTLGPLFLVAVVGCDCKMQPTAKEKHKEIIERLDKIEKAIRHQ